MGGSLLKAGGLALHTSRLKGKMTDGRCQNCEDKWVRWGSVRLHSKLVGSLELGSSLSASIPSLTTANPSFCCTLEPASTRSSSFFSPLLWDWNAKVAYVRFWHVQSTYSIPQAESCVTSTQAELPTSFNKLLSCVIFLVETLFLAVPLLVKLPLHLQAPSPAPCLLLPAAQGRSHGWGRALGLGRLLTSRGAKHSRFVVPDLFSSIFTSAFTHSDS